MADVTTSDYTLRFDGGTAYTLFRDSDGASFAIDTGGAPVYTAPAVDGITLQITVGATAGDRFSVRPTAFAARDISMAINSTDAIAAASPVRAEVSIGNIGNAAMSLDAVGAAVNLPLSGPPASADIVLTFDALTDTYLLVPDPLGEGPLAFDPTIDGAGRSYALLGGDITITLSGAPQNGDQLTLAHNAGAAGDNRNLLSLLDVQTTSVLDGGLASMNQALGAAIAAVGTQARNAQASEQTFAAMLDQAESARERISGVNLDEEAANLLRFQQSFQAAGELIRLSNELFQTVIGLLR